MELKIEVNDAEAGQSVMKILDSFTWEERKELALKVMREWLQEPISYEKDNGAKNAAIVRYLKEHGDYAVKNLSVDEMKNHPAWAEAMEKKFPHSKAVMIQEIVEQVVKAYTDEVVKMVRDDEGIQQMKHQVLDGVRENFPAMMEKAVMQFFVDGLTHMQSQMSAALNMASSNREAMAQIANHIGLNLVDSSGQSIGRGY